LSGTQGLLLKTGDRVVFFGDSITAAEPGYVSFIREMLDSLYPERRIEIVNKGVGGNRVTDLLERVDRDVLALEPDWVSIAIGINDVWHGPNGTPVDEFRRVYEELLDRITEGSHARVVLCTPSIIEEDPESELNIALRPYVDAVREIGARRGLLVVPVREAFLSALERARQTTQRPLFTTDGVHLNQAGNTLFGTTWLKALGAFGDLLP